MLFIGAVEASERITVKVVEKMMGTLY